MTTPTQIDHLIAGNERLITYFQDKPVVTGLLNSYLERYELLESLLFDLLDERGIYQAIGKQLDNLGSLFDIAREGRSDSEYRAVILQRIATLDTDGTTEVFLQGMRTLSTSDFVDFWEHDSGDVHALLGAGATNLIYSQLKDLVAAGIRLRVYVDEEFDSFQPTEILVAVYDLQTNALEDIQVSTDGLDAFDLQVQINTISDTSTLSILYEIEDTIETRVLAELLYA